MTADTFTQRGVPAEYPSFSVTCVSSSGLMGTAVYQTDCFILYRMFPLSRFVYFGDAEAVE
jgi:Na+/H+-dicarboxylate symporter